MLLNKDIKENLRFLLVEVVSQLDSLINYLVAGNLGAAKRVAERRGYAENLKRRIHQDCLEQLTGAGAGGFDSMQLRAIETIASELEIITELCRDCVTQLADLESTNALRVSNHGKRLHEISRGLDLIVPALEAKDVRQAQRLADLEARINRLCRKLHKRYSARLKEHSKTKQLIAGLFIARNIEQMGHCLLSISDAIISSSLGQPMNLRRFNSLQTSIASLGSLPDTERVQVEPVAETRSGSAISAIAANTPSDQRYLAIFKDGEKHKLKEERQGVESWHEIYPGLAPKIIDYHKRGKSAALLIEHLAGQTFEHLLLHESDELLQQAMDALVKTLDSVWNETLADKPVTAGFMRQAGQRMTEVYALHPEFLRGDSCVCGLSLTGFDQLLLEARKFEAELKAPFSVYIHGDFNIDNIIYDPGSEQIRFIDLHRSCYMDYVQDVSVFMVSNYRLQIFDTQVRRRIRQAAMDLYRFAAQFAQQQGDEGFELRLALGLARSFATSTRFILDETLASNMYQRAQYLLKHALLVDSRHAGDYRIPVKELFVG